MTNALRMLLYALPLGFAVPAAAVSDLKVSRKDAATLIVSWQDAGPVNVAVAEDVLTARTAKPLVKASKKGSAELRVDPGKFLVVVASNPKDKTEAVWSEREVALERGSNFRDVGGFKGEGGKTVRWGKVYRSGALPLLTEADYATLGKLNIGSIVDLRAIEERDVAPTMLDDRTGALFVANDYSLKSLMASYGSGDGEFAYRGMGKMLAPQYRAIFKRMLANDGAVMYHCSAGQDRTGIATALVLSALGVDRQTIVGDYHLSTALRRPQNEMPAVDPKDYPGNPIVQYYAAAAKKPGGIKAEPLYTPKGNSHLVQFFELIDKEYGGVEGYLKTELGINALEVAQLRAMYLE